MKLCIPQDLPDHCVGAQPEIVVVVLAWINPFSCLLAREGVL